MFQFYHIIRQVNDTIKWTITLQFMILQCKLLSPLQSVLANVYTNKLHRYTLTTWLS